MKIIQIGYDIEGETLLDNIHFEISPGECCALLGKNGSGKSTLFKVITGQYEPTKGHVQYSGIMGYLPQDPFHMTEGTAWDFLEPYAQSSNFYKILGRLGVQDLLWQPVATLSGGERTRVYLAKLMLQEPDLLLLDEPTNHLDAVGLECLIDYIQGFKGRILMVSHDRHFVRQTANVILALEEGQVRRFNGGYDSYKKELAHEKHLQAISYEKYVKKKAALEAAADQQLKMAHVNNNLSQSDYQRQRAKKIAKKGKSMLKRIDRLEAVEKPKWERPIPLYMNAAEQSMKILVKTEGLSLSYEGRPIFETIEWMINRGDRIALTGVNGSGKTSLVKAIMDPAFERTYCHGVIQRHPRLTTVYISQELECLDPEVTLLEALQDIGLEDKALRNFLGAMNFKDEDVFKRVGDLSYGEKARAVFLKAVLEGPALLVLDEPTNYLDVETRETIETLINQYEGAILAVTHDRMFIEMVLTEEWHLSNKGLKKMSVHKGGDYYKSIND